MSARRRRQKKAIATIYASVLFLMLTFSILLLSIISFTTQNQKVEARQTIDDQRRQERIYLSVNGTNPVNITITNNGTIETRIRSIYLEDNVGAYFLFDPSTSAGDSYIKPSQTLILQNIQLPPGKTYSPDTSIFAATERGVKSLAPLKDPGDVTGPQFIGSNNTYSYGPLMLVFDDFFIRNVTRLGEYSDDIIIPGWRPLTYPGDNYRAWIVEVMNNGTINNPRNITINKYSCFTLTPVWGKTAETKWYLETSTTDVTQFLELGKYTNVTYMWTTPKEPSGNQASKIEGGTTSMLFLTFFGVFHELNGTTTPFAQTIPFEAVRIP